MECRVSIEQVFSGKNVEVDSGAEDDEDLASADQGFAIKAFPGVGGMQQPLIAISHEDYSEDLLANFMKVCISYLIQIVSRHCYCCCFQIYCFMLQFAT